MAACNGGGKPELIIDASVAIAPPLVVPDAAMQNHTRLPGAGGPNLGGLSGAYLADVDSCGACHPDAFAQQQSSVHALASFNNPIYRMAVERLRDTRGMGAGLVCAGCHDAALLTDGAMQQPVSPSDPRAHNGVSCRLCHGITSAGRDGNGSFVLDTETLPIPVDGDAASLDKHRKAVAPPAISELCGSCHQSFLSTKSGNQVLLAGQNEMLAWADSAYAGQGTSRIDSVPPQDCIACHMPKVAAPLGDVAAKAGKISSHRALGGHTWLAAMRGDTEQVAWLEAFLKESATIDVAAQALEGGELSFDIVIRNVGVGHRFPGGVRDAANTRVRVRVLDEAGRVLLQSGGGEDEHVLRAYLAADDGRLIFDRETHEVAAPIADHTIAPRDVAVVRYRGPETKGKRPHRIEVELVHKSRSAELVRATCAESRSNSGQEFARHSSRLGAGSADGCAAQPELVIASGSRTLTDTGEADFDRRYQHGLGLLHEMQERLPRAKPILDAAFKAAGDDTERAMALVALGRVAARLGRVDEALEHLNRAETLAGPHAAIGAGRGDAFAKVWRWKDAADAYAPAVALAPGNATLWRRYALALGSSGQRTQALQAAQTGLALMPRDADLLRVQGLALRKASAGDAKEAMKSYFEHRGPDNKGAVIRRCTERSRVCAREALPVHEHQLQTP